MMPSRTQEFGREALSGALQWPPGRAGGGAHDLQSRFGVCLKAADQRAAPLPVMRAGPSHVPPLGGSGALSKDPGSHSVSSQVDACRQPSRRFTHGLFLTRGAIDAALNFGLTTRHQPGSDSRRECPERLPCVGLLHPQKMEQTHGEIAASEYVTPRRGA